MGYQEGGSVSYEWCSNIGNLVEGVSSSRVNCILSVFATGDTNEGTDYAESVIRRWENWKNYFVPEESVTESSGSFEEV